MEKIMLRAKIQAPDVARIALDGCDRGELYVLPHEDGRVAWRLKRLAPESYARAIVPRFASMIDSILRGDGKGVTGKVRSFFLGRAQA
jgi:hypothetical protein